MAFCFLKLITKQKIDEPSFFLHHLFHDFKKHLGLCSLLLLIFFKPTLNANASILEDSFTDYVSKIQQIEHATYRISWTLENFKEHKDNFCTLFEADITPEAAKVTRIKQFLGVDSTVPEGLIQQLDCVQLSCDQITDIFNKTPKISLADTSFKDLMDRISTQLLSVANALQAEFIKNFYGESVGEPLRTVLSEDSSIEKLQTLLGKIGGNVEKSAQIFPILLNAIVNIKNSDLIDATASLSTIFQKLNTSIAKIHQSLEKGLFSQYDPQLDFYTSQSIQNVKESLVSLIFNAVHETSRAEYIDLISSIENVLSSFSRQLLQVGSKKFFSSLDLEKKDLYVSSLKNVSSAIQNIKNDTIKLIEVIKTSQNCVMMPSFIKPLRDIEKQILESFNQISNICLQAFQADPTCSTIIGKTNKLSTMDDVPDLLNQIRDDIAAMEEPFKNILKTFQENFNEEIGIAITNLREDIVSLSITIGSNDPNSLLQTLAEKGAILCCHPTNVPIDQENIKKIQEGLDNLPFMNLQPCCNSLFDSFQNLQMRCFQIFRYLQVMQNQDQSYSWEAHRSWKRVLEAINQFLEQLKTQTPIITGELSETNYCKTDLLLDYLKDASTQASTMCSEVRSVLEDLKLTNFVFEEPVEQQNRGCSSIATFLVQIQTVLRKICDLFPNIQEHFLKSDYAFDNTLKETLGNTAIFLKEVAQQVGKELPRITDICSQCHFLTHREKVSDPALLPTCPDGTEHLDVCQTIYDTVIEISNHCTTFKNLLETSLCCHQPYIEMVKIQDTLTATRSTWNLIANLSTPYLSIENINSLAAELDQSSSIFTKVTEQLKAIQDLPQPTSPPLQNPCFWYSALPFLKVIGLQNNHFYLFSTKIAALFNVAPSTIFSTPPLNADFCQNNQQTFKNVTDLLGEIQQSLLEFNKKLNQPEVIPYSESLEVSFLKSLTALDLLSDYMNPLWASLGLNSMTCIPPIDPSETTTVVSKIAKASHEIWDTIRSNCCSYFSRDLYHSECLFRNLNALFETLSIDYSPSMVLTEIFPLLEPLTFELSNMGKGLKDLKKDIKEIPNKLNTLHCKIYFLTNHWYDFNEMLKKVSTSFANVLTKKNGTIALDAPQDPAPDHFNCSTLSTSVSKVVEECSRFSKQLKDLGVLLRQNPPFGADNTAVSRTLTKAKQVFMTFCEILKIFEPDSFLTTSLCTEHCKGCTPHQPIQAGVLSSLITDFEKNFNKLNDLLSKPGCCVSLADEMVTLSNHFLKFQKMSSAFGELDKIILKIPEDIFVERLGLFSEPLIVLQNLLTDLCKIKQESLGATTCTKKFLTPSIQSLNLAFDNLQGPLQTIFETFGPIPYTVEMREPNRLIAGCEDLSLAVEKISEAMNVIVQNFQTIVGTLTQEKTRPYYPSAIAELEKIGNQWSLIQAFFARFFTIFNESFSCEYCEKKSFTKLIKQNFQNYNTSMKRFSDLFNEDPKFSTKNPDTTLIGGLKSYCCSESNVILREIAVEFLCIQQLVLHIANNPKLFEITFDAAIMQQLAPIQHRFSEFLEAINTYGNAIRNTHETFCKIAPNVEYLRKAKDAVVNFKNVLVNFANWTQSDCSLENIIPFNSKPYDTQNAIDSINNAGNISQHLDALLLTMQADVAYAYNPDLCNFIQWVRQQKVDEAFSQIALACPCPYCPMNFDIGFLKTTTALTAMQKRLENPTCCQNLQKTLNEISATSQNIIDMSDNLLNRDTLSTSFSEPMFQNIFRHLQTLTQCGESFMARLDVLSKNSPCLLRELETPISEIKKFSTELALDLEDILLTFGGTTWINSDAPIDDLVSSCQGKTGLEYFLLALAKTNAVGQHIANIIHEKPLVDYRKELPVYLNNILKELSIILDIFKTLATKFSTFTKCYACRDHDNSYTKQMLLIGQEANTLHGSFSTILTDMQDKCCSPCFGVLNQLTHQMNRINAYADKIIHDNPSFVAYFFSINGPYDILSQLNGDNEYDGIFPKLIDLLGTIFPPLTTLSPLNQMTCVNIDLVPAIQDMANVFKDGANIFQSVYENKYKNGEVVELNLPKLLDYSCHSNVLNNLIVAFKKMVDHVEDLAILQDENVYSIDGDILASTIDSTVEKIDTIFNFFSDVLSVNTQTPIVTCITCPPLTSFFLSFKEGSQKIRDAFKKIKIKVKETRCCQPFIHLTGLCSQQISEIQKQTRYFLQANEKELLHIKTIEGRDNDKILDLVPYLTLSLNTILKPMQEMNKTLQNVESENSMHCFSMACFPYLSEIHKTLKKLNSGIKTKMREKYHYCDFTETTSTATHSSECNGRIENIQSIVNTFNEHLSDWDRFSQLFGQLDLTCEASQLSETMAHFAEALAQVRQALKSWGENNKIITITEKIDEQEIQKEVNLFCLKCLAPLEIATQIQWARSEDNIFAIFSPLINHSPVLPSHFIKQPLNLLSQNIQRLEAVLSRLSSSPHFTALLSRSPADPLWSIIVQAVQGLVPTIIAWKDMSAKDPSKGTILEKNQQLITHFSKINESLFDLCSLFERLYSATNLQTNPLYLKRFYSPVVYQKIPALFEKVASQFDSFAVTWGQFCNAVDHYSVDACRESMAQVFNDLHETFKTLYLHIPPAKTMHNLLYSQRIGEQQHGSAKNTMKKVVQRTNLLLNSLWAYNCCNSQASCLHILHQLISKVTSMIQLLKDPADLEQALLIFEQTFLSCAQGLRSMYVATVSALTNKKKVAHCQWDTITPCFTELEQTLIKTSQDLAALSHSYLPEIESWDTRSTSSKNDCGFLPNLHVQISDTLRQWSFAFLSLCSNEQKNDAKSLKLMRLQTSLNQLGSALDQLLELSKGNATIQRVMCQSCDNLSLLNSLVRIHATIQKTSSSLENVSQTPQVMILETIKNQNIQLFRMILEESAQDSNGPILSFQSTAREKISSMVEIIKSTKDNLSTGCNPP